MRCCSLLCLNPSAEPGMKSSHLPVTGPSGLTSVCGCDKCGDAKRLGHCLLMLLLRPRDLVAVPRSRTGYLLVMSQADYHLPRLLQNAKSPDEWASLLTAMPPQGDRTNELISYDAENNITQCHLSSVFIKT